MNKMISRNQKIILALCICLFLFLVITSQAAVLKVKVVKDSAEIRSEPAITSSIVAKVPIETILESSGKTGDWYQVSFKYRGQFTISGYIHKSFIEIIEEKIEKAPEPEKIKKEVVEEKAEEVPTLEEIPAEKRKPAELSLELEKELKAEEFFTAKSKLITSFEKEKGNLLKEKSKIEKIIEKDNKKIKVLNSGLNSSKGIRFFIGRALDMLAIIFFPGLKYLPAIISIFVSHILLLIILPIFMINLLLYLNFREKEFFKSRKKLIIVIFLLILLFFYLPTIFGAEPQKPVIKTKLDNVNELLRMSLIEKAIFKLEKKPNTTITIPQISVSNPHLKPWKEVNIFRPEYHFSLGALYFEIGNKGKAVDELRKIFEFDFRRIRREEYKYQLMLISLTKFFLEGNMIEAGSEAVEKLIPIGHNVATLIDFSEYLYQKMMHDSAKKVINRAIEVAEDYRDLIKLSGYLLKKGLINEAYSAAEKAILSARKLDALMEIVGFTIENQMFDQLKKAIERYISYCRKTEDYLRLADFLINKQMIENASKVIKESITNSWKIESLIEISRFAINKKMYEQAISAIEKSLKTWRESGTYLIDSPRILDVSQYLPTDEKITLPVYLGIIQQEAGFIDKSRISYETAIMIELDQIINSFGFEIKGNLNNFFYLKQLWLLEEEFDNLKKLNPLYSFLEKRYLNNLEKENNKHIEQLKEENENLIQNHKEKINQIQKLSGNLYKERIRLFLHIMRLIAFITLIVLILIGVVNKSLQAARRVSVYKFFAFVGKFIEVSGWLSVFTIIDIPFGVAKILIGQVMQIFQKIQQNGEKSK